MGTSKRERQKANRQQKMMEEAKAEQTAQIKRRGLRWGSAIVAAIAGIVLIAWVGGAFDGSDEPDAPTITLPPIDTSDVDDSADDTTTEPESTSESTADG